MKRNLGAVAAAALAVALVAVPMQAQLADDTRPITFGLAGGLSLPLGDFGDAVDAGYIVQGSLGVRSGLFLPIGTRLDLAYSSYDAAEGDGTGSIFQGTANLILPLGSNVDAGIRPYLIGGVGAYNFGSDFEGDTEFGLNGGAGLRFLLSGFSTFVEARYNYVFTEGEAATFLPIVFGVTF